jgi:hypothetical protein
MNLYRKNTNYKKKNERVFTQSVPILGESSLGTLKPDFYLFNRVLLRPARTWTLGPLGFDS